MGNPQSHGWTGQEFGMRVSELAHSGPMAVAYHVANGNKFMEE